MKRVALKHVFVHIVCGARSGKAARMQAQVGTES